MRCRLYNQANSVYRRAPLSFGLLLGFVLFLWQTPAGLNAQPSSDQIIYTDALAGDWIDWSWDTTLNFSNAAPVQAGAASLAATYNDAWAGVYLHADTYLNSSSYSRLRFWVHGGSGGNKSLQVALANGSNTLGPFVPVTALAGTWTQVELTMVQLGSPAVISGVVWQDASGSPQSTFYLDEISLVAGSTPPATLTLQVNVAAGQHPIRPDIYGMNFADEALAQELRLPVRRWGGNDTTRYNWQNDTSNHASDWYFENIRKENNNPAALPNGSATDKFVEQDRRTGTKTLITVPLIGWTSKAGQDSHPYDCGFKESKYGDQQATDPYDPDCGNGVLMDGTPITGNDPTDTSLAITTTFVVDWINHLAGRYGTAAQGGVALYNLDNEPMLWNDTHRDVHPNPVSYDEMRDRTYLYAAAIKAADPAARTLGPVVWGWTAYFYSALDAAPGGAWWTNPQDRNAHGGTPFVPWYLQQMQLYEQQHGLRILDYLDLHYYPQATGVSLSPAGDAATQARRLRSTRSLWDPTYTDESWINEPVYLIPRMRDWVNQNYPGTRLALTEYNWGALNHLNGALAQADVLGIFGREGLDLATLWDPPSSTQPGAFAFRLYRNYDGAGSAFGDTSVAAASSDQDTLAIYAARRSTDNALTIIVINKSTSAQTSTVTLAGFSPAASATVYRYSGQNLTAIVQQPDQPVTGAGFSASFPASSITLFVLHPASPSTGADFVYLPVVVKSY